MLPHSPGSQQKHSNVSQQDKCLDGKSSLSEGFCFGLEGIIKWGLQNFRGWVQPSLQGTAKGRTRIACFILDERTPQHCAFPACSSHTAWDEGRSFVQSTVRPLCHVLAPLFTEHLRVPSPLHTADMQKDKRTTGATKNCDGKQSFFVKSWVTSSKTDLLLLVTHSSGWRALVYFMISSTEEMTPDPLPGLIHRIRQKVPPHTHPCSSYGCWFWPW